MATQNKAAQAEETIKKHNQTDQQQLKQSQTLEQRHPIRIHRRRTILDKNIRRQS